MSKVEIMVKAFDLNVEISVKLNFIFNDNLGVKKYQFIKGRNRFVLIF